MFLFSDTFSILLLTKEMTVNTIVEEIRVETKGRILDENPDPSKNWRPWWWDLHYESFLKEHGLDFKKLRDYLEILHRDPPDHEREEGPYMDFLTGGRTGGRAAAPTVNRAGTRPRTAAWLWWGGDCKACIEQGGLHVRKPVKEPPLHPNCDCTLKQLEIDGLAALRLMILLERGKRVVREINLLLGDKNLSEENRARLLLVRKNLDEIVNEISGAGKATDFLLNELEKALADAEKQASEIKYVLSLREANSSVKKEKDKIKVGETYPNTALDKADDEKFHKRLEDAAREFGVPLRVVKAAFASEYWRRWEKDEIQDRYPWLIKKIPLMNDFGLSNIDYHTAVRLKNNYDIDIPPGTSLEDYLCTDEGCARFTSAAIKEAEEELDKYTAGLPPEKKEIMDSLNREEKDALAVAIYKRGPEAVKENLDEQLDKMAVKRSRQKYVHVLEGYKAWEYWKREEEYP
jgi:hypothetical protein